MANANNANSNTSRRIPGIAIGAEPGSLGTRNVAQSIATIMGIPAARKNLTQPSPFYHPQIPKEIRAAISSKKRSPKLVG